MWTDRFRDSVDELESLARRYFADLTRAEVKLLRAAPSGKIANCAEKSAPQTQVDVLEQDWPLERRVRAELIAWLCTDLRASSHVHTSGVFLSNAWVSGAFDLSFVKVSFPLTLAHCRIPEGLILRDADMSEVIVANTFVSGIEAGGVRVRGDVFLRHGFSSDSEVNLMGAMIGGALDCSRGTFRCPGGDSAVAIAADGMVVRGSVFLNDRFSAIGEVRLMNASIGGNLTCTEGHFEGRADGRGLRHALSADGIAVKGEVCLGKGFAAIGEVRFVGSQIDGNLDCTGAVLGGGVQDGESTQAVLSADGSHIRGQVFLNSSFRAKGDVQFIGARVDKGFECIGIDIDGCLSIEGAVVQGGFHWLDVKNPQSATLILANTSASRLLDEPTSWPLPGNLVLDGFRYDRVAQGPRDALSRLDWISRTDAFSAQPYRQLAKVLREEGDAPGSKRVLFEMEHRRWKHKSGSWMRRVGGGILRLTVGYGYRPHRALICLAGLILVGFPLFWAGYCSGKMVPTDKDAYHEFVSDRGRQPPAYYGRFHALVYSFENSVPLVKLGQVDRWWPTGLLHVFGWLQVLLGWFFTTMGIAAVTGIVHADKD